MQPKTALEFVKPQSREVMPGAPDDQSNKRGVRVRSAALGPHLPHTRPHVGRRTCPGQLLLRLARFPHRPNIGPKKEQPGIIGSRSSSDVLHYVESWTGQAMSYMLTRARNAHGKTVGDVEGKEYLRKVGESKSTPSGTSNTMLLADIFHVQSSVSPRATAKIQVAAKARAKRHNLDSQPALWQKAPSVSTCPMAMIIMVVRATHRLAMMPQSMVDPSRMAVKLRQTGWHSKDHEQSIH